MTAYRKALIGAFVLALAAAPAIAANSKDKAEKPPKKDLEPVSNDPQLTTATYGNWVERCQRLAIDGQSRRICEATTSVAAEGQSAPFAEVAIGRVKPGAPMQLTLVVPVNVSFPSAPNITLPNGASIALAWQRCVPAGCFAAVAFDADAAKSWRGAKTAKVESKAASGAGFNFEISLRGLPQALDALERETGEPRN